MEIHRLLAGGFGAALTEARYAGIDDAWISDGKFGIADPQALGDTGAKVFDHDVSPPRQLLGEIEILGPLQIQHDPALVAVDQLKQRALACAEGPDMAVLVALGEIQL